PQVEGVGEIHLDAVVELLPHGAVDAQAEAADVKAVLEAEIGIEVVVELADRIDHAVRSAVPDGVEVDAAADVKIEGLVGGLEPDTVFPRGRERQILADRVAVGLAVA